ncbi:hypothetical protein [Paraflavitalea speifideaquila]|uniref:hypothetical protein n=1 Tax=Paraflavitalea speifideaquila TaxID=3076558 RepID=UPI0028F009BC|nr:hypothetical protein [Paraflavitalea speifideiaquila]
MNHGRINEEKCRQLEKLIPVAGMDEVFICGPESMIFSVKEWLETKGLEKKKIHFELFSTPESETGNSKLEIVRLMLNFRPLGK